MNILFYDSDVYMKYTPEQLEEDVYAYYLAKDYEFYNSKFKCIVDFGYPQKMSIRIVESDGIPFCTIHINYEEYDMIKYLCNRFITFEDDFNLEEE